MPEIIVCNLLPWSQEDCRLQHPADATSWAVVQDNTNRSIARQPAYNSNPNEVTVSCEMSFADATNR